MNLSANSESELYLRPSMADPAKMLLQTLGDHATMDVRIRRAAAKVLPHVEVYGTPECVPALTDVVDLLVERLCPTKIMEAHR